MTNITNLIQTIQHNPRGLSLLQEENKIVKLANKGLILGKSKQDLALEIIGEFPAHTPPEIISLLDIIDAAINSNSVAILSKEDLMYAEKVVINQLNKDPSQKEHELLKDLHILLSTRTHDREFSEIISLLRARHIIPFEWLGIDSRFKPRRKDFYIIEEKDGAFVAIAPSNSKPHGYVLGYSENKLLFLGYKDEIIKQEYTRNYHRIKLLYGRTPEGKIITKLTNKEVICKNVPLEEISDSLAEEIKIKFLKSQDELYTGIALSGDTVRKISGKVELEKMPYCEFLDDVQTRLVVAGSPGTGKTIFTNIIQWQVMNNKKYLTGGVVTISKDVPHLTNVGCRFKSFADQNSQWDEENLSTEFVDTLKMTRSDIHKRIVISQDSLIPDINKLNKETILALVQNSSCSDQVKVALKKCIEESDDVVQTLKDAQEGMLLGAEYTSSQDDAAKRLINSIIPAKYESSEKIDLRKTLEENKHIAFFIKGLNADAFASMIMWELYSSQKEKEISNPSIQGRLLVIDECQKFMRDEAFKDIFQRTVLDGRNFGICMITIFQNEREAEKSMGYPEFKVYKTFLENGKRKVSVNERVVLIPAIAPEVGI
jgi:hypothetical protein